MTLILLILVYHPTDDTFVEDHCDRIEINHVLCDGVWRDYLLFWELRDSEYVIRDWRKCSGRREPTEMEARGQRRRGFPVTGYWVGHYMLPQRGRDRHWVSVWYDEKTHCFRKITGSSYLKSWTALDREVENRDVLASGDRRLLTTRKRGL